MAEGDIFKAVPPNTAASKREALAALARGGTSARDAYMQSIEAQKADQSGVMRDILDRATAINAPEAGEQLAAEAAPGMDRRGQALLGARSSTASTLDAIAAANRAYMDQVSAATPIVEARARQALAERRAREAEELTPGKLISQLGGLEVLRSIAEARNAGDTRYEYGAAQDNRFDEKTGKMTNKPAAPGTFNFRGDLVPRNATMGETATDVAEEVGLGKQYGPALTPPTTAPKKLTQGAHRADVVRRVQEHASPATAEEFELTIGAAKNLGEALTLVSALDDEELKSRGVSRDVLRRWVTDYFGA